MGTPTIEGIQVESSLGLALPQPQVVGILSIIPRDYDIVSNSEDLLATTPNGFAVFNAF